jgi:NACHT domain-containing protein
MRLMAGAGGRHWPIVAAGVGVLVLVAAATWLSVLWVREGSAEVADQQASVFGAVLASALAAVGLVGWAWRRRRLGALPATAEQLDHAASTLAGALREQWQAEAVARSLGDPEPMPVRWRLSSPSLMDDPAVIGLDEGVTFSGRSDRIGELAAAYRALPRRRLVLTGGPGTGKTTLALQLLLELLPPPGQPPTEPVPVLFSLASWDPNAAPRVQDWLVAQLARTYPALAAISPNAASGLVAQGWILPVLDGLDEVPADRRASIITALNRSLDTDGGLILTSRRAEYRDALATAEDVVTGAAVIAPLRLTPAEAASYLRKHLSPARSEDIAVLDRLAAGNAAVLAAATATPLGLWLIRVVYLDTRCSLSPLADPRRFPDAAALRFHLLDGLIPAVVQSRPPITGTDHVAPGAVMRPARQYRPEDLRRWLTALAEHVRDTGTRDWLWWQLAPHTFPATWSRVGLRVGFAVVLAPLLAAVLVALLTWGFGMTRGLEGAGIPCGVAGGILIGLHRGLAIRITAEPRHLSLPARWRVRDLCRGLVRGFLTALAFVVSITTLPMLLLYATVFDVGIDALPAALANDWGVIVLAVMLIGFPLMPIGLVFGLMNVVRSGSAAKPPASPRRSYRADRDLSIAEAVVIGTAAILSTIIAMMSWTHLPVPYAVILLLAAYTSSELITSRCTGRAWFTFLIARVGLSSRSRLPRPGRVMGMLNDAHRLGLLRTIGPAYQFRHAELQDHLAPPP